MFLKHNKHNCCITISTMIITFDLPRFILSNLFFLDTKRNIIMDGNFTKLIYSNDLFTMNGLYILFPVEHNGIEKIMNKNQLKFYPNTSSNLTIIQDFSKLETRILEYYKQSKQSNRKIANLLSKQMNTGFMKTYKEFQNVRETTDVVKKNVQYVIKISGIWETRDEVGLTYKLFEVNENYIHDN